MRKPAWFCLWRACGCSRLGKTRAKWAAKAADVQEHPHALQELSASWSQACFCQSAEKKGKGRKKASASTGRISFCSLGGGRNPTPMGLSTQLHISLHHADNVILD